MRNAYIVYTASQSGNSQSNTIGFAQRRQQIEAIKRRGTIVGATVGSIGGMLLIGLGIFLFFFLRRRNRRKNVAPSSEFASYEYGDSKGAPIVITSPPGITTATTWGHLSPNSPDELIPTSAGSKKTRFFEQEGSESQHHQQMGYTDSMVHGVPHNMTLEPWTPPAQDAYSDGHRPVYYEEPLSPSTPYTPHTGDSHQPFLSPGAGATTWVSSRTEQSRP